MAPEERALRSPSSFQYRSEEGWEGQEEDHRAAEVVSAALLLWRDVLPEDIDKKTEDWLAAFEYMRRARFGPPPEEQETLRLMETFHEFLIVQLLAMQVRQMPEDQRQGFMNRLRKNWKASLRQHINGQVKKHEEVLSRAPDSQHLVQFIGDGEAMRVSANKQIKIAEAKVEDMLKTMLKKVSDSE